MQTSNQQTNNKKLIVVVHCRIQNGKEHAVQEVTKAKNNGADGVFLILHGGRHTALIEIYHVVREKFPDLYIGINFLDLSADSAYENLPEGAQALWTDDGIDGSGPDQSLLKLHEKTQGTELKCRVFAGLAFKYRRNMDFATIEKYKNEIASLLDIITTSGPGTGQSIDQEKVEKIHSVLPEGKQMGIASGVKFNEEDGDNVTPCLPYCDWFIVASSLETRNGDLNEERIKLMADHIHAYVPGSQM